MRKINTILFGAALFTLALPYENKFNFVSSGSGSGKIRLQQTPEKTEIAEGYSRLTKLGEGYTTEKGMPELPLFTTYYQLDPAKTYEFELEILESYTIENIDILPHQGMGKWEVESITVINAEFYNSYAVFPENNLTVSERAQGRGIEFVNIQVIPYKYYPKYHKLEVYSSIEIHVIETGEYPERQLNQPKRSRLFDQFYKDIMVNFEESDRPEDYQTSTILYICGGSTISNSYVQDLIEWRHKQGYIVVAVSESEVGGSSASSGEIKNYISDAYFNWENPPEIVGLIGDTGGSNSLPNYNHGWEGYYGATDFDYTQLTGGDMIPEVFIGRISGSTSDIEKIINKTLHYEKADQVNDDWFTKAGLLGDPDESGNSTIYTNQYIENMMINHGMDRINTDYDGSGTQSFMEQQFNNGILYYNYRGYYYGSGSYPTNSINNGFETPFVTTITCGTGDYDGTSSSEQFVWLGTVNNPKGAVGAVGMGTIGTHTLYNNIVDMGIYDGIFPKKLWLAGPAVANGDLAIVLTYPNPTSAANAAEAFSKWSNLIGDPALHLWSGGTPTNFAFVHPSSIALGTTMLDLTITDVDSNPVENARVTLLMGDDVIFTSGLTDLNGEVTLEWEAVEEGSMYITVIKQHYRPYEGTIDISAGSAAAVALVEGEIIAQAGEHTNFEVTLKNYGVSGAKNVVAEIISPSDQVTILQNTQNYGTINPDESTTQNYPVYIHGTAYDGEDLGFKLLITDDLGNHWENHLPVYISGSHLIATDYIGETYPGISTELSFNLENWGSTIAEGYKLELLPYENLVSVNSGHSLIEGLSAGDNLLLNGTEVSFSSIIINGTVLPMELLLTSSDGFNRNQVINVLVGEVRETDPLGPDSYGYYIYDAGDTDYDLVPEYDWIEIAEGMGDQLSITDSGHGNCSGNSYTCSSTVLNLPFTFTFYGEDYTQIVVNTNGWISFGNFEMYSFRNYPIPGAGGPSPMVAAFWDDLRTGSGGYVHHYESDEMVVIQWDYIRTYDGGNRETFEIILYNKENSTPTATGDSEIKIQYQEFNNTSNGDYYGWPPIHGCYSTVGIENHMGDTGLEYTFNNTYPEAAATLGDGSAIFITTRTQESYTLGDLNGDGAIDVIDVVTLVNIVLTGGYDAPGDMNQDGACDILDVVSLVNIILS